MCVGDGWEGWGEWFGVGKVGKGRVWVLGWVGLKMGWPKEMSVGVCSYVGWVGVRLVTGLVIEWVWVGEEGSLLWVGVVVGFVFLEGMLTYTVHIRDVREGG